jgi:hypothetical protein
MEIKDIDSSNDRGFLLRVLDRATSIDVVSHVYNALNRISGFNDHVKTVEEIKDKGSKLP